MSSIEKEIRLKINDNDIVRIKKLLIVIKKELD